MARTPTNTPAPQGSNLNSLANGAAKSLGKIDFNTNDAHEATIKIKATLGASGVSASGILEFYFIGAQEETGDWTDGIDPTSTSDVAASIKNARRLPTAAANANGQVVSVIIDIFAYVGSGYSYGAIIVKNSSGAALASSGNDADYQTVVYS
jgi:hypothetical protein